MLETTSWEEEKIFFSQTDFFTHMIDGIQSAQKSICLESYIYANDSLGKRLGEALIMAAKRGVEVKILVDGVGSPRWAWELQHILRKNGIDARTHNPLRWTKFLNKRNHRKVCIIDHVHIWAGGMNICQAHESWRDTSVYVKGVTGKVLEIAFLIAWEKGWWPERKLLKASIQNFKLKFSWRHLVRLNLNQKSRKKSFRQLLFKINNAKNKIWITNPYFIPPQKLIHALKMAGQKNVDVRLVLPHTSDIFFIPWVSVLYFYTLLKSGPRLFLYLEKNLHAKTLIIDDWAIVGSTNLNHRSLLHDLEADIVLKSKSSIEKLEEQFLIDLNNSKETTLIDLSKRSKILTLLGRLLFLFKNWM